MRSTTFDIRSPLFLATKRALLLPLLFFLFAAQGNASSGFRDIALQTSPGLGEVTALSEPTRLVLTVLDAARKPLEGARLRLRLRAPESGWLPTDMPRLEGAPLLEIDLRAVSGSAEWEYLFPIRGTHRLEVTAFDENGELGHRAFNVPVKESRLRLFYLATFSVFLFCLGLAGGRWLYGSRRRHRLAAGVVAFFPLLSLCCVSPSEAARAEEAGTGVVLKIDGVASGQMSRLRWSLVEQKKPVLLTVTITNLEEDRRVLFLPRMPAQGSLEFGFRFTDGGRHRVISLVEIEGEAPVRQEKIITVAKAEPAPNAAVPTLLLFLVVVAAGMYAGYYIRGRRRRRARRKSRSPATP
jgi:hypothetical protein